MSSVITEYVMPSTIHEQMIDVPIVDMDIVYHVFAAIANVSSSPVAPAILFDSSSSTLPLKIFNLTAFESPVSVIHEYPAV